MWKHLFGLLSHRAGRLQPYAAIDWGRVNRLIMVCTGNICRSPYAEYRARTLGVTAISCGLRASPGAPADDRAVRNAADRGVDLTAHRSRASSDIVFTDRDLVVAMEPQQANAIARDALVVPAQVTLLGLWGVPQRPYIHDPYGTSDACFQRCYGIIDRSVLAIARLIDTRGPANSGHHRPPPDHAVSRRAKGV